MTITILNDFETLITFEEGPSGLMEYARDLSDCGLDPSTDVIYAYETQCLLERAKEDPYHKHPDGEAGASDLGGCPYKVAYFWSGLKYTRKTGEAAKKGNMRVGSHWHSKIVQPAVETYYTEEPIPLTPFATEVHIKFQLFPGLDIVSPIDAAFLSEEGTIDTQLAFKKGKLPVRMKHPEAEWKDISDIKSAGDNYGYGHTKSDGLSFRQRAQGHAYMFAAKKKWIKFHIFNKKTDDKFTILLNWDEQLWQRVIKMNRRKLKLSQILRKTHGKAMVLPTDFVYIYDDSDFECVYGCPHSETKEVPGRSSIKLELVRPCKGVCKYKEQEAKTLFVEGSLWFKANSQITIDHVVGDLIEFHNKGNKDDTTSIWVAFKKFRPRAVCPQCQNTGCKQEVDKVFHCPNKKCQEIFEK